MGVDPRPYTLRQLQSMVNGRLKIQWDHTAAICATVINMHRAKGKPIDAASLNPFRKGERRNKPKIRLNSSDSMKLLKRVFIDHQPPDIKALQAGILKD